MPNRIGHIDIAKGISIILVALFHTGLTSYFPKIIGPMALFRLPLFFFLSGVFFKATMAPNAFFWKKFDALLKPYFATLILVFIVSALFGDKDYLWQLIGILYGNGPVIKWVPMWFLPHLFTVYCFVYLIFRYTPFQNISPIVRYGILFTMLVVGIHFIDLIWNLNVNFFGVSKKLPGLPFSIDIILISSVFFIMGILTKEKVVSFRLNPYWLILSLSLFFLIASETDAYIDLNARYYNLPFIATIGAACGIYMIIAISFFIDKLPILFSIKKAFLVFGSSSLFILIFHRYIYSRTYEILCRLTDYEPSLILTTLSFLAGITIPLIIKILVSKSEVLSLFYFPLQGNTLFSRICSQFQTTPSTPWAIENILSPGKHPHNKTNH